MSDFSSLLNSLYDNDSVAVPSLEKTAEEHLIDALRNRDQTVEENVFDGMSTEELIKIAEELQGGSLQVEPEEDPSLLEKTAAEMLGGQVMAHSFTDELHLIKTAMINGLCRVCKESPMDIEGSSVCSGCHEAAEG
jgi:hypothetical protein